MVWILLIGFGLFALSGGRQKTVTSFAGSQALAFQWRDLALKYSLMRNIPLPIILGMIEVESGGNPAAVGGASDIGLMQVTPIALQDAQRVTVLPYQHYELTDPEKNIDVGTAYLKMLLVHYNLPLNDAIRAYNVGPGTAKADQFAGEAYRDKVIRASLQYE